MNHILEWWQGEGGNTYIRGNEPTKAEIEGRTTCLKKIFEKVKTSPIRSILEVGAGPGATTLALRTLYPKVDIQVIEPNLIGREALLKMGIRAFNGHAEAICAPDASFDLVVTSGVLIHIHPDHWRDATAEISRVSKHYVLAIEYFSFLPSSVLYHGEERLWRGNFGKLYLESGLKLLGWGFFWEGQNDTNWWFLEKR